MREDKFVVGQRLILPELWALETGGVISVKTHSPPAYGAK